MPLYARWLAALVPLLLALSGCAQLTPGPNQARPTATITSPRPQSTPAAGITPSTGSATVKGRLVTEGSNKAFTGSIYLGRTVKASQPGVAPLVAFSEATDPRAEVDAATGDFQFTNVPAGSYALLIWNPTGGTVLHRAGSSDPISVEATAGNVTDLGTIPIR